MRLRIAISLLAGTLLSIPAWAQTTTAPASGSGQQGTTAAPMQQDQGTTATRGATTTTQGGNIQYITQNRHDLWRASKLEGVNVYNQNNERIGDISEVLVNTQGQVEAVVIGVGGFLGIGDRDVAVPYDALQWQNHEPTAAANTSATVGTTAGIPAPTTAPGTTATTDQQAADNPAMSSTTASPATTGAVQTGYRVADTAGDRMRDYPVRAILPNATKDLLQNAPEFRYAQ
jgi:sporulation protein YlmC with PRC-barrel domain